VAFQDFSSTARRRIAKVGKRDVAAHLTDTDDRTMGGVALDLTLDLFAEGMPGNEGDERQGAVHRKREALASLPRPVRRLLRLGHASAGAASRAACG
jgi:hypothetical protein